MVLAGRFYDDPARADGHDLGRWEVALYLVHEPRRKRILVEDRVRVIAREPMTSTEPITCGIPGHDQPGQEWVADVLDVQETGLRWKVEGKCAFASNFSYQSASG